MGNCLVMEASLNPDEQEVADLREVLSSEDPERIGSTLHGYTQAQYHSIRLQISLRDSVACGVASQLLRLTEADHPSDIRVAAMCALANLATNAFCSKQLTRLGMYTAARAAVRRGAADDPELELAACAVLGFAVAYDHASCEAAAADDIYADLSLLIQAAHTLEALPEAAERLPLIHLFKCISSLPEAVLVPESRRELAQLLPALVFTHILRRARLHDPECIVRQCMALLVQDHLVTGISNELAHVMEERLLSGARNGRERAAFVAAGGVSLLLRSLQQSWSHKIRACYLLAVLVSEGAADIGQDGMLKVFITAAKMLHFVRHANDQMMSETTWFYSQQTATVRLLAALWLLAGAGVHGPLASTISESLKMSRFLAATPCSGVLRSSGSVAGKQQLLSQLVRNLWDLTTLLPAISMKTDAIRALWALGVTEEMCDLILQVGLSGGLQLLVDSLAADQSQFKLYASAHALNTVLVKGGCKSMVDEPLTSVCDMGEGVEPMTIDIQVIDTDTSKHYSNTQTKVSALRDTSALMLHSLSTASARSTKLLIELRCIPALCACLEDSAPYAAAAPAPIKAALLMLRNLLTAVDPCEHRAVLTPPLGEGALREVEAVGVLLAVLQSALDKDFADPTKFSGLVAHVLLLLLHEEGTMRADVLKRAQHWLGLKTESTVAPCLKRLAANVVATAGPDSIFYQDLYPGYYLKGRGQNALGSTASKKLKRQLTFKAHVERQEMYEARRESEDLFS